MRPRVLVLSLLLTAWAIGAAAALSPKYATWAEGPEGFLLTKKEQKEWKAITNDAEAQHFIELFWGRRDPNLQTPVNEFKADFDRRVAKADKDFGFEGMRGALSDRGRVLVLMGSPHKAEKRAPTKALETMDDANYGSDEARANAELWMYDSALLPAGFKVKGSRVLFVFYERKMGTNDFILDRSHPDAPLALRAMGDAPEVWLVHPELTEVPKPVAAFGGKSADPAHLEWLAAAAAPWSGKAVLVLEPGAADASFRPLWAQLALPADAPVLDELSGRVLNADGAVNSTFQIAAKPLTAGAFKLYHVTFPLEPGRYRVELAGASGGQVQVVSAGEAELTPIPAEGAWMSPLWVGLDAQREEGAPLGAAYTFGGWHLTPLVDPTVTKQSELSYFGFIAHPGTTEGGATAVTAQVALKRGDKRLGQPFVAPLRTVELVPGLHLYANSLALGGLTELGEYTLDFTITDSVAGVSATRAVTLNLSE